MSENGNREEYTGVRKIVHEIRHAKTDDEKEILDSDDKAVLEAQRDQAILDVLEAEKTLLKQKYPQYKDLVDEQVTSGYDLELWSGKLEEMAEDEPKRHKPKGQASLEPVRSKDSIYEADSYQELVDNIYSQLEEQLFLRDMAKPYDVAKLKQLEAMRSKLLESVLTGEKLRGVTKKWSVWTCPKCGISVANSRVCEKCGYENKSPSSVRGRVSYV